VEQGTETRTLYEDWSARRRELAGEAPGTDDSRAIQIEVLDYLLERYRDSAEAARPVCCSQNKGVYVNDRALIVLRHLGRDWCRPIKDRRDASEHVRSVIGQKLFRHKRNSAQTFESRSLGGSALDHAGETLRLRLSHPSSSVRWSAAMKLALVGRLEDIGLLSDLLTIPCGQNERAALLFAMRRLSQIESNPAEMPELEILQIEVPAPEPATPTLIDTSIDPGPPMPDWTCAICGRAVSWYSEKCDGCGAAYSNAAGDSSA
jgi:hypothetical protein